MFIRHDMRLSSRAVKIMVSNLVHDNITVRKVAIHNMAGVLRQHKRKHPVVEREVERGSLVVGDRPDNAWLQYKQEHWPRNKDQWNSPNFVHKTHFGYYCWPEKMMVYAGEELQPRYSNFKKTQTCQCSGLIALWISWMLRRRRCFYSLATPNSSIACSVYSALRKTKEKTGWTWFHNCVT